MSSEVSPGVSVRPYSFRMAPLQITRVRFPGHSNVTSKREFRMRFP